MKFKLGAMGWVYMVLSAAGLLGALLLTILY